MKMKRMILPLMLILALVMTTGCGLFGGQRPKPDDKVLLADGATSFEVMEEAQLPAEVKEWVSSLTAGKTEPFQAKKVVGDKTYLLVFGGEHSSGGYRVVFEKIVVENGTVMVNALVVPPNGPATTAITYPVGVARIPRHDGEVRFQVDMTTEGAPAEIKTGNVEINPARMKELQEQVDSGHQPWRLDPLQVAMEEGQAYGFDPARDKMELTRLVEVGGGSGTGEAYVDVTMPDGSIYEIELIQPNGPGKTSIWTINAIRAKQ